MTEYEFRKHRGHGANIDLAEVLATVPANDWQWTILEFDGVGNAPIELVGVGASPVRELSWEGLKAFADRVHDTWWFLAAAVPQEDEAVTDQDDLSSSILFVRAFDSTTWEFGAPRQTSAGLAAVEAIRARFDAVQRTPST